MVNVEKVRRARTGWGPWGSSKGASRIPFRTVDSQQVPEQQGCVLGLQHSPFCRSGVSSVEGLGGVEAGGASCSVLPLQQPQGAQHLALLASPGLLGSKSKNLNIDLFPPSHHLALLNSRLLLRLFNSLHFTPISCTIVSITARPQAVEILFLPTRSLHCCPWLVYLL